MHTGAFQRRPCSHHPCIMRNHILFVLLLLVLSSLSPRPLSARQESNAIAGLKISAQQAEGSPVGSVVILLDRDGTRITATPKETELFYTAFDLRPGALFREIIADMALKKILEQPDIASAEYSIYNEDRGGQVTVVFTVAFVAPGKTASHEKRKGILSTGTLDDFPVLAETETSKLVFIMNGGLGLYNDHNGFFSRGAEFTVGNPVADYPADKGGRLWGEAYIEGGLGGITRIGNSKLYGYGAATALLTGRVSDDIYSEGNTGFFDVERLYAGMLVPGIGKNGEMMLDLSYGRQFFQLNDGFLISKYSGSANAGERGSLYLNSRTAFEKAGILRTRYRNVGFTAFLLEPQELFEDRQTDTRYGGASLMYNDNKTIDAGITYIEVVHGSAQYRTPLGAIPKEGMYIVNPKLWLSDIGGSGVFLKTEYAWQAHHTEAMESSAWYVGLGIKKSDWAYKPSLYYRYAVMKGDDASTDTYERFDPMLTGGLGNWVQGINFRKVIGNGNIISHRVELKAYPADKLEVSLDYFHLMADSRENLGALAPISRLEDTYYGQEFTLTSRYFLNDHFMLMGLVSHAIPGKAIREAFDDSVQDWTSLQCALFMFF